MNCFEDYVGVLGCNMPIPESGLYINSLPGMPLMSIDMIANPEQVNFVGVWNDVQIRASHRLLSEVTSRFSKRYKIKSITHSNNIGKVIDATTTFTPIANGCRGIYISQTIDSCCSTSNLQSINIQSIFFFNSGTERDVIITIVDSETITTLFTKTKTMITGWNIIPIEQSYNVKTLYILFSADDVPSVSLPLTPNVVDNWRRCVQTLCENDCCNGEIKGIEIQDINDLASFTTGDDTFGLSAIYSLTCSYEPLICENRNVFKTAYWYLLGLELVIERIYSSRMNWWKINKTENESLVELFTARADEAIQQAVDGIALDMNDICLSCDNNISIKNILP